MNDFLVAGLYAAALCQVGFAGLSLFLVPMLGWQEELARWPLLHRQVFMVHAWFISFTCAAFALLTFRFAREMAAGDSVPLSWLAAVIGCFWLMRAVIQLTYYSSSHWRGKRKETIIHIVLLFVYVLIVTSYGAAAAGLAPG